MSLWRCPHCGTPQAETARCWVCRRSSTTCSTCRHFRRSIAAQLGYCGLDRRRLPLAGTELRGCWEQGPVRAHGALPVADLDLEAPEPAGAAPGSAAPATPTSPAARLRDFVPVALRGHRIDPARPAPAARPEEPTAASTDLVDPVPVTIPGAVPAAITADRATLFADADL